RTRTLGAGRPRALARRARGDGGASARRSPSRSRQRARPATRRGGAARLSRSSARRGADSSERRKPMTRRVLSIALAVLSVLAGGAAAHDRGASYSSWPIEGRSARVVLRFAELDLSRFDWAAAGASDAQISSHAMERLQLFAGEVPCALGSRARR